MAGTKYAKVAADAFSKLQLNAGVLLTDFDTTTATVDESDIIGATSGGTSFTATPQFIDFGEGIDNVPANTLELKRIDYYEVTMSGTLKTLDTAAAKKLIAAADVASNKVTPRHELLEADFSDLWWVGDYSEINADSGTGQTAKTAGYIAIHMMNALSTGGFQLQSNDKDKGDFAFTFTGHYSMDALDTVPFELYIKQGTAPSS